MGEILIRKGLKEDIPDTVDITIDGWRNTYKGILDDDFLDNMDRNKLIERRINDYNDTSFIVALLNNEIVGFSRYIDSNKFTSDLDIDSEIIAIYVKSDKKRQGIGKEMFKYISNELKVKNKEKLVIWCLKDNYQGRKFYETMGGSIKGEHNIKFGLKEYPEIGYIFNL